MFITGCRVVQTDHHTGPWLLKKDIRDRERHYQKMVHKLGLDEVRDFFDIVGAGPGFNDAVMDFIRRWEVLLGKLSKIPANASLVYPGLRCAHCDEPISLRDEGDNGEFLWLHQGRKQSIGIEPITYCPFPYLVIDKILRQHPDWASRIRSACNICSEEITFPTYHRCLIPEGIRIE